MTARVAKKTIRRFLRFGLQRSSQPLPPIHLVCRAMNRLRRRRAEDWRPAEPIRIVTQEALELMGADDYPELLLQDPNEILVLKVSMISMI